MKDSSVDMEGHETGRGHSGTHRLARTAVLFAPTSATVNWATSNRSVLPSEAVALCVRCGGRVVGRTEADYSCLNCGRYPLDQPTGVEWHRSAEPGRGHGKQFSGAAVGRY